MGFRLPRIVNAKPSLKRTLSSSETTVVPKGHFAVYAVNKCHATACGLLFKNPKSSMPRHRSVMLRHAGASTKFSRATCRDMMTMTILGVLGHAAA
ncbi:hypothetical protein CRYUN_Cryun06bG0032700 [Craigia yunnanensis]